MAQLINWGINVIWLINKPDNKFNNKPHSYFQWQGRLAAMSESNEKEKILQEIELVIWLFYTALIFLTW